MADTPYPAARAVAAMVHPHFARHLAGRADELRTGVAAVPDIETIESIIDVAFWASLRREESYAPRISLAFVAPGQAERALVFERSVPLGAQPLTHLGPAVERPGIHLCVWRQHGALMIWGATRLLPLFCFVLEVIAPGLLVVKHSRPDDAGKFVNIAVLQGDEIKIVDAGAASRPGCPERLNALLGLQSDVISSDSVNFLIQLAVSMRAHGRGGLLLVVPSRTESWRESILQPVPYAITPPFRGLADLAQDGAGMKSPAAWHAAMRRGIEGIAGLTAVDGAVIVTDEYELLAFGAKIVRRSGSPQVNRVILTEAVEGAGRKAVDSSVLGGTRHLSAAQFAHDQPDAIALVASQDGRFTVFGWSPGDRMVYVNRIEALLL